LGYDDVTTIDGINQVNAKLLATLPSVDEKVKLSIANALWVSNGSAIKTAFSDKLKESYLASVDNLDFSADNSVNVINNWANVNTNGLIPKVVDFIDPLTKIFLANALYFKGDWGVGEFMGNLTMNFTDYEGKTSKVDAMEKSNDILYNSNDKCAITTLPIGNGSYTYTAVLPNDNVSVSDAVASLTDDFLNGVTSQYVSYKSPKFDIENELTLNSYLRALGIKSMFDDSADFSNMTDNKEIFLNCVMHNTNISVSEQGLEAAAVTDEIWASWCPDDGSGTTVKIKEFFLNKPFAFIIRETSTNAIVFIGAVNKL
jgi:serpin B